METNATTSLGQAVPQTNDTASSRSVISSDFETFLKMLTVQAEYQDPLDPIDSSEYAAQLAQFSLVEQQVLTNDLLEALLGQSGEGGLMQTAAWLGKEALSDAPALFEGQAVTVYPDPNDTADAAFLVVRDELGREVYRQGIPITGEPFSWDGRDQTGFQSERGLYQFQVESYAGGELLATEPALSYARINETRTEGGAILLVLEGGASLSPESVKALR